MGPLKTVKRLIHCDWSANERKRATCVANKDDSGWRIEKIALAGATESLITRHREGLDGKSRVIFGFDFPIGYPSRYGILAGLQGFTEALRLFGRDDWIDFFKKAETQNEISLKRPFYPRNCATPGFATQEKHRTGLGLNREEMYRRCELPTVYRNAASPVFWTLGPQSVGTAAMLGWKDILQPIVDSPCKDVAIWPFQGTLENLLYDFPTVIVETYPGEAYSHLGFPNLWSGKTNQTRRRERAETINNWAENRNVRISEDVQNSINDGFGERPDGEDPFDALIGLCSMIDVVEGNRTPGRHPDQQDQHEGWIFGQATP